MTQIDLEKFQQLTSEAQAAHFSGWDFEWLEGRMIQQDTPWDYVSLVKGYLGTATSLLDIIQEMVVCRTSERQGRAIDQDQAGSMEKKKIEGYF